MRSLCVLWGEGSRGVFAQELSSVDHRKLLCGDAKFAQIVTHNLDNDDIEAKANGIRSSVEMDSIFRRFYQIKSGDI